MPDFNSRPPTPHELLVEAMAATAWETMTKDEGRWTDAIEEALVVAKRDHAAALLATLGTTREGSVWHESWEFSPTFVALPPREGWDEAILVRPFGAAAKEAPDA